MCMHMYRKRSIPRTPEEERGEAHVWWTTFDLTAHDCKKWI